MKIIEPTESNELQTLKLGDVVIWNNEPYMVSVKHDGKYVLLTLNGNGCWANGDYTDLARLTESIKPKFKNGEIVVYKKIDYSLQLVKNG